MTKDSQIVHFEDNSDIRRTWHSNEWYYSIVDIVSVLADNKRPRKYWSDLKVKLTEEGYFETSEKIGQLKMKAPDGKMRETDVVDRKTVLRIIQSIPSPKAEPFKLWLAQLGEERLEEIENPELGMKRSRDRAKASWKSQGHDESWIKSRTDGIDVRNRLTDGWDARGAEDGLQFAILTNTIHEKEFDLSTQGHKKYKNLPANVSLRDNMTPMELALTTLSETAALQMHEDRDSQGFDELKRDATDAGQAGRKARLAFEEAMGSPIVSSEKYPNQGGQQKKKGRG